jgi:branched-chain amino acid aminotransferase
MAMVWFNGDFTANPVQLDTTNRSFRYGDGLFETIKVCFGKAVFFHQHYVRLIEGLDFLRMDIPETWSVPYLQGLVERATSENGLLHARVRLTCWRSGSGWYMPETNIPSMLIEASPLEEPFYRLNTTGIHAGVFADVVKSTGLGSSFKSANALPYILASLFAKENNWQDAFLINQESRVADALHSNIFIWKEGILKTPHVSEGCVDGVMRRVLIKYARKWGIPVEEVNMELQDLRSAEEVFLTNTQQGIQWVGTFEQSRYDNKMAAGLLARLNELLPLS